MSKKASILVVDDEPHVRKLVKANLESSGYKVLTAGDGEEAVETVEQEMPDLVISGPDVAQDGWLCCVPPHPRVLGGTHHHAHCPQRRGGPDPRL